MSGPIYTQFTERMYSRLPEVVRETDALNDHALKRYISAIGDVEDQVERLITRFTYLDKQDRLTLDSLIDDYSYYDLDYSYFQATDSKASARITSNNNESVFIRSDQAHRIVPNTTIYVGAVFRTDVQELLNTYGLRLWYYDAGMNLIAIKDAGRNNGSTGPQWVAMNGSDSTPAEAYYVRISPFGQNTSGVSARIWVDDVYVRSHYEVTTTNNLISGGHVFTLRTERELVKQGDFDNVWDASELTSWDLGPGVSLVEKSLPGAPEAQSYRLWMELGSTNTSQPGYARQVVQGVESSSTYTISLLAMKNTSVPDASMVRVTVTPNTGGPTVKTFGMEGYEKDTPTLLTFTWNSPETVSTAIVNVEYVTATNPAQGLFINDVSMVGFTSNVSLINRQGDPVTTHTNERIGMELFSGRDVRGTGWIRYATMTDPDTNPLPPGTPDIPGGTSFIEAGWHETRPDNSYTFSAEIFSNHATNYVDIIIWHKNEGKGWGEAMVHRVYAASINGWVRFDRTITIPADATEFRLNLDYYRSSASRVLDLRNVSMMPSTNRSWYRSGSRPFAYNALVTKGMNFLSRGDLMHYTANLMVTGAPSNGRYGVRVYSNNTQVVHETTVYTTKKNQLVPITGSFQVPEDQADLRVAMFVSDPTPKHQAAYFLSDLEVVHSTQRFVDDPQNVIVNGGFENLPIENNWKVLTERVQVRRNMVPNPIGPTATSSASWRSTSNDTVTLVQDEGRPALKIVEGGESSSGVYLDPDKNYTGIPVGSTIRFSADVKVTADTNQMRLYVPGYNGAERTNGNTGWIAQSVSDGWVRHRSEAVVTASPAGSHFRALIWPGSGIFTAGQGFLVRDVLLEINTDGDYFDRYSAGNTLSQYTWDSANQTHVETRKDYTTPVNPSSYLNTALGYNKEDVPARPEGLPLGTTSDLVDPRTANTEWLPWLAQFAGRDISHFSTMEEARAALSSGNNFSAGTIGSIQSAVQAVLTGSKTVRVFPMTSTLNAIGGATQWDISIVTRTSESPDVSVLEDIIRTRNAKPAGVVFHFHEHQSTWDAVELANPTWDVFDTRDWVAIEESGLDD